MSNLWTIYEQAEGPTKQLLKSSHHVSGKLIPVSFAAITTMTRNKQVRPALLTLEDKLL